MRLSYLVFVPALSIACAGLDESGLLVPDGGTTDDGAMDGGAMDDVVASDDVADAGPSDDGATETAPPFDPASVAGLALWLAADFGVTADGQGVVSAWADKSGNANDATETRAGLQPTWVQSGIGGKPTIHFASVADGTTLSGFQGNDLSIADSKSMEWGKGDFLVEVAARYTNDPSSTADDAFGALYIAIYGPPDASNAGFGLYGNVWKEPGDLATSSAIEAYVWGQPAASSSATGYNDDSAHVFAMQRVGTTLTVRIDAAVAGSQNIGSVDLGKTGGRLGGCENAQAQRLEGDVSEVIAVSGTIAPGDLAGIESYLKARYATP